MKIDRRYRWAGLAFGRVVFCLVIAAIALAAASFVLWGAYRIHTGEDLPRNRMRQDVAWSAWREAEYWLTGAAGVLIGLGYLWWALTGRAAGVLTPWQPRCFERRLPYLKRVAAGDCPWCGYTRAGLKPVSPCPECGRRPIEA